jgi:hypothetical protein
VLTDDLGDGCALPYQRHILVTDPSGHERLPPPQPVGQHLPDRDEYRRGRRLAGMPTTEKLPPGPYYEPVTSWREIAFWLVGIVVIVTGAALALIYLT